MVMNSDCLYHGSSSIIKKIHNTVENLDSLSNLLDGIVLGLSYLDGLDNVQKIWTAVEHTSYFLTLMCWDLFLPFNYTFASEQLLLPT